MMNKITAILMVFIAMVIKTPAQTANNGFENWTTTGSYENPNGWATMNNLSTGTFHSCTKSTDHYPVSVGNYSIRIENNTLLTQMTGGWGMVITGTMSFPLRPSFPLNLETYITPKSLTGYYKYNSMNNDSMFIRIILFEKGIQVVDNMITSRITTTAWTSFNIPLTYTTADSATILMGAFYPNGPSSEPKGNSVLYVDNLQFDSLINTSVQEQIAKNTLFKLYPNPASYITTLNFDNINNVDLTLNIYNVIGSLVKTVILEQSNRQINIGDLSDGVYNTSVKT